MGELLDKYMVERVEKLEQRVKELEKEKMDMLIVLNKNLSKGQFTMTFGVLTGEDFQTITKYLGGLHED